MKSRLVAVAGGTIAAILAISFAANDANARIRCKGRFQVIKSQGLIATPFCEANEIARVAHSYGVRVSANTLRHNVNRLEDVCQYIGHDTRIADLCAPYRNDHGRRRWP